MFKKSEELRKDLVKNLMRGEGEINRIHLMESEDFNGYGRLFAKHILEPGSSIGLHKHEGEQEAYYILEGEALYNNNGEEINIKKGDFTLCKNGEVHSIKNVGKENLEFIGLIIKS